MTHSRLTAKERKVKAFLLSGKSAFKTAGLMKISKSTVYHIVDRLVCMGEIRPVPGTSNPIVYEDPQYLGINPPIGGCPGKVGTNGVAIQNDDPYETGVSSATECPEGYWEAHINGMIEIKILKTGTYEEIKDARGLFIGYWEDKPRPNGRGAIQYSGKIRLFGQELTVTHRIGNKGAERFYFYPQRLYFDPNKFESQDDVRDVFVDRANYVCEVLHATGWQLKQPQIKGYVHYAFTDHPAIRHMPLSYKNEGADLIVDTSHGVPELELTHSEDPRFHEKAVLMANLPTRFLAAEDMVAGLAVRESEDAHIIGNHEIRLNRSEGTLSEISSSVDEINEVLTKLTDFAVHTTDLVSKQQLALAKQLEINNLILAGSVKSQPEETYKPAPEAETSPKNPVKLEGYQ